MDHMTAPNDATTSPARDALVVKVRKLLAMAEGSGNPNEADAFSAKAAALIAEHRIDPERLRAEERSDLAVIEFDIGRGAYARGRLHLLQSIASTAGCDTVFTQRQIGTVAMVAGFRTDLDGVELLYHSLHAQASTRMAAERRSTGAATQRWRRSFLFGFGDEVHDLLERATDEVVQKAHPSQAALPVLRERRGRVAEYSKREFGRVRAARRPAPVQTGAYDVGVAAAHAADLGRRRVGGLTAIAGGRRA